MPLFFLLVIFFPYESSAQFSASDSNYLSSSLESAVTMFQSFLKESSHLFNGWQNTNYEQRSLYHPYFMQDSMQTGSVVYDGTFYKNIPLLYDENNDNLLTLPYFTSGQLPRDYAVDKKLRMDLIKEKTTRFTIAGHEFVRLDSQASNIAGGFYERPYNGDIKMYIKRSKKYIEEVKQKDLEIRYETFDEYYILKNKQFYRIKSQKNLFNALEEKGPQVKNFVNNLPVKFRKNKDKVIFETVKYYDQLKASGSK